MPGASLPVFFFVTLGLVSRAVWGKKPSDWWAPPKFARNLLLVFLGAIFALSAWGLAHGGTTLGTFRQIVHLMQLPIIAMLFLYALRVPEDLSAVGTIFVVTALGMGLRAHDYQLHALHLAGRPWISAAPGGLQVQADDVMLSVAGRNVGSVEELAQLPPGSELASAPAPSAPSGASPGTIVGSNPPGGIVPGAGAPPAVPILVSRSKLFVMREEVELHADEALVEGALEEPRHGGRGDAEAGRDVLLAAPLPVVELEALDQLPALGGPLLRN